MDKSFVNILCLTIVCVNSQKIGDPCFHKRSNNAGTCKLIFDCDSEYKGLGQHRLPQSCGADGSKVKICCPEADDSIQSRAQDGIPVNLEDKRFYGSPQQAVGRKSYEKCREYGKYVNVSYVLPGFHTKRYRNDCGIISSKLIVGGTKVKSAKEFPHMAAIFYPNGEYGCGGSLISENFVISAAHCVFSTSFGFATFVRLGDLNLESTEDDAAPENFTIIQTIKYPEYNRRYRYDDIVLFRLDRNATFNAYVRPICLPIYKEPPTKQAVATGWGRYSAEHNYNSDDLMKVTLNFYTQEYCNGFHEMRMALSRGILEDSQICAGAEMKDTCDGDSGGPLQIYHEDVYCMYMLIGITSFGRICSLNSHPAVYTRVQNYLEWIERHVWP